ncbi:MAG: phospholipase D-like domain-containing protein [Bacteroidales bacterium]
MKKNILIILVLLISALTQAQTISIDSARTLGPGNTVTISGIVTNGSELGTIRYMQDSTAGIAAYDYSFSQDALRGDSVTITGTIKDYNQLLELDPVSNYTIHSSGNPLPSPQVITPSQINEAVESELVRINGVTWNDAGAVFSSNSAYTFNANGQSAEIFVRSNHPLIGQIIPSNPVDIIGLGSQYDYSNPNGGYQLILRDGNDIIASSSINLTSRVSTENITTSGFDLLWTTDSAGSSEIFYGNTPALELGKLSASTSDTVAHRLTISGANASEMFYAKAFSVRGQDTAVSGTHAFITRSNSSGEIIAYFTTETDTSYATGPYAIHLNNTVDDTLVAYIDRATESIDFSIYTFNNQNIANISTALNNAHNRGVTVRVIYDGDSDGPSIQSLDPGIGKIASPTTSQYGIMHNKFIVFDAESNDPNDPLVWTGATNFGDNQINDDDNDVIIIQDKSLALTYRAEFNEMFGSDSAQPNPSQARFGPDKLDNTPHEFIIGGKRVECYFSPSDNANDKIIKYIESADDNLRIATMLITRSDIQYALEDAISDSVDTKIMINNTSQSSASLVSSLQTMLGNDFQNNDNGNNIMHHKYMIVDEGTYSDPVLLTGCHNWSYSANDRNDENTLIIHDNTIANIYLQAFMTFFPAGSSTETIDEVNYSIWPNPVTTAFTIETQNPGPATLTIYSLNGQVVKSMAVNSHRTSVDVENLEKGLYIVELIQEGKTERHKIIIQ